MSDSVQQADTGPDKITWRGATWYRWQYLWAWCCIGLSAGMLILAVVNWAFGWTVKPLDTVNEKPTRIEWDGRTWIPEEKPDE